MTGFTVSYPGVPGKALQFFKEAVPGLTRVAAFVAAAIAGNYKRELQDGARALTLELHFVDVSGPADFERAFASAKSHRAQALHITEDATLFGHRARLAQLAALDSRRSDSETDCLVAGYDHGWFSDLLMRVSDVFLAVPQVVLAITIAQTLGPSAPERHPGAVGRVLVDEHALGQQDVVSPRVPAVRDQWRRGM
jgi:hypothetical protein